MRFFSQNFGTIKRILPQPRSQGLRGETVTKTLVKFVLSFQNFGEKIACAVRHNRIQPLLQYGCVALRMRFFPQNFGTIKRILPGSSSPSHREGPGTEVDFTRVFVTVSLRRPWDRGWIVPSVIEPFEQEEENGGSLCITHGTLSILHLKFSSSNQNLLLVARVHSIFQRIPSYRKF